MLEKIEEVELVDFKKRYIAQDFRVLKIKTNFDIDKSLNLLNEVTKNYSLKNKDGNPDYSGICLHYRDDQDPLYDGLDQIAFIDKNKNVSIKRTEMGLFVKQTEIGAKFNFIDEFFNQLKLSRGRILVAKPNVKMAEHRDGPYICTLHFPIKSKMGSLLIVDGKQFHLVADGSCYLVNVELPHYIKNDSDEERIHIVYSLSPLTFKVLTQEDLKIFNKYFNFLITNFVLPRMPWIKFTN